MRNAGLDEAHTGIKFAGRNINNLRYADDTNLMAESKEELKSLLMKVKDESDMLSLKLDIQNIKVMASGLITSWQIDGETVETLFWGALKLRHLLFGRKVMTNLDSILKSRDIILPTKAHISKLWFF